MFEPNDIRKSQRQAQDAAYVTREEARPLMNGMAEQPRRKNLIRFDLPERHDGCCGGTRFPGEPTIRILPDMGRCLPGRGCNADPLKFMDAKLGNMRKKLDIYKGIEYKKPNFKRKWF